MEAPKEKVTQPVPIQQGIIYLSRLPYGFDDKAAFDFFPQFGEIKGVSFPRSKKTGRSKGYMFVLFSDIEVAKVAVKTMNGYMIIGKQIQASIVENKIGSSLHKKFKATHTKFKFIPWKLLFKQRFNTAQTEEAMLKKMKKLLESDAKKRDNLKELKIKHDFPGYQCLISY